jgi:catechol 2,3-dioxygenase-like lactoylglutathione lyase family enzyme
MALHRIADLTIGVPNVKAVSEFYASFGLVPEPDSWFSTSDGGRQLRVVAATTRRAVEIGVEVDDLDDIERISRNLAKLGHPIIRQGAELNATDPGTGMRVRVVVAPRMTPARIEGPSSNGPGRIDRPNERAAVIGRHGPVRPRRLGHVVVGTHDHARSQQFFTEGIGFRISDEVRGRAAFLRCSTDHHNLLIQRTPVKFLHHSSWQVDDVDEVGRGAAAMLEEDPTRHTWGLGRHHIGSNYFWYLRDPVGNFAEYYSDLDCIVDDQLWEPRIFEGKEGLWSWGPPPPPSFLTPDDLADLMAGGHQS